MKPKYRLFRRSTGIFYWQEIDGPGQGSLKTKDKQAAKTLLNAKNEGSREPRLNLALGRAYLSAHDPKTTTRTWQHVMDEMAKHGIATTQERCARALKSKAYDSIRNKCLIETTAEDILNVVHANGNAVKHYMRRLHNLAVNLGWLAWALIPKAVWPRTVSKRKRAITASEHARIVAAEENIERRKFYELLYETGAAQTDGASLRADDVDWAKNVLSYRRKKLGPDSPPAQLSIGPRLRVLLESLPRFGPLFPTLANQDNKHRATDFWRRCDRLGIKGVSLHSYRHSWAERAKSCGYPQRFAQVALGHSSKAVHEAYAKSAQVICPSLDDFESGKAQAAPRVVA